MTGTIVSHAERVTVDELGCTRRRRLSPRSALHAIACRHAWWVEIAVVLGFYFAYESTRALAGGGRSEAEANAHGLVAFERATHLDPELTLNHALAPVNWLSAMTGYYYLTLHFAVTIAVLTLLYLRRPHLYAQARTSLVLASAAALVSFWLLPVAPPRLAEPGIFDLVVQHNIFGAADAQRGRSPLENVYAAMPSLHVGWALWAAMVAQRSWSTRWRRLAWGYPVLTALVVLCTGNHYLADVLAGAATVVAADWLTRRVLSGSALRVVRRRAHAEHGEFRTIAGPRAAEVA
jgi:hypothetical protein